MKVGAIVVAAVLFAAPANAANSVVGGFAFSYLDPDKGGPTPGVSQFSIAEGNGLVSAGGNLGAGTANSIKSQTRPWVNKLEITSDTSQGFVYGSGTSVSAINQQVTGSGTTPVNVKYSIGIDGSFTPGPTINYLPPQVVPAQNLTYYFLAYKGTAYGISKQTDQYGDYLYFDSSVGHNTLSRAAGDAGFSATLVSPFAARAICFGAAAGCLASGSIDATLNLSFDVLPGEDYFIVTYLSSQTNGQALFFNTARLLSVQLDPGYGLISGDGGAMQIGADGIFRPAVPEPATWAMLIGGFGLVGGVQRRWRLRPA